MNLLTLKAVWNWISSAAATGWKAVKKLPGWAILVLLTLCAVCWWLYRSLATKTAITEIQTERVKVETDYKRKLEEIVNLDSAEEERIKEKYEEENKVLDDKEQKLFESVSKGPVEIAKEWDNYLRGKNEG